MSGIAGKSGGSRKRAGRPRIAPGESNQRSTHQIRAFDNEYDIIKRFIKLVRISPIRCEEAVKILELNNKNI